MLDVIPCGLDALIATYGDCSATSFEATKIRSFTLPYPLFYDGQPVKKSRGHKLAIPHFCQALEAIRAAELTGLCQHYGGIYNQRPIRGRAAHPSTHSWGIAIDLEPARYPLGSRKRFPDSIIQIFRQAGFFYGGDFQSRTDGMHFQLCTGY